MENEIISAQELLKGTGLSLLDAARFVRNILDAKSAESPESDALFCHKIIETGKRHACTIDMPIKDAFSMYIETKCTLRPDSRRDIRYLGSRLIKSDPSLAERNFSELGVGDCESWLSGAFSTPSQFNKARAMLHGLFQFAVRRQWCEKNIIKFVERRKVIEKEIKPLSLSQAKRLLETAGKEKHKACLPALGLLMFAGIRPVEVRRLTWRDIDLLENSVTVRSACSKTGGARQVEICPALKSLLREFTYGADSSICPPNWQQRWRKIRDASGFRGVWVQDVLRHTYASYHAKYYKNFNTLQLNMGHRDHSLLLSRYVNMYGISKSDAENFFRIGLN